MFTLAGSNAIHNPSVQACADVISAQISERRAALIDQAVRNDIYRVFPNPGPMTWGWISVSPECVIPEIRAEFRRLSAQ